MFLAFSDLRYLLTSRLKSRIDPFDVVRTPMRVWPHHLDLLRHVNNGMYLFLAGLSRWEHVERCGYGEVFRRHGWYGVISSQAVRYRRGLRLWQKFTVETRFLGLDGTNVLYDHRIVRKDEVIVRMVVCVRMLSRRGGPVPREQLLEPLPYLEAEVPRWATKWVASSAMPMEEPTEHRS